MNATESVLQRPEERAGGSAARKSPLDRARAFVGSIDRDFAAIILLFLCLRVGVALFFLPGGNLYRGDSDIQHYRRLAELSTAGFYPYLDYWMEYPPVFPWLVVGIYKVALLLPAWPESLVWFQCLLSATLGLADAANLVLVYVIAARLHDRETGRRAAVYYSLLFFPAYAILGWFDTLPLFFLLLAVALNGTRRPFLAGLAAGVGLMTKLIPAVAAPSGFLGGKGIRQRAMYVLGFGLAAGGVAAPFLLKNPTMTLASVRAMFGRSSWETVWSCVEGYCGSGSVPSFAERFDPALATTLSHPQALPWAAITGALGVLLLVLYTRRLNWRSPNVAVPAVGLTLLLMVLFSKGYSPQFLIYVLALLVVIKPRPLGALQALLLTAVNLLEYPFAEHYFATTAVLPLQRLAIGTRTLLFVLLAADYALLLVQSNGRSTVSLRRWVVGVFFAVGLAGLALGGSMVVGQLFDSNPTREVAARISALARPGDAVVASSRETFYRTRPALPSATWLLADEDPGQWPVPLDSRLDALVKDRSTVWLILDFTDRNEAARTHMLEKFDRWGSRATDEWIGKIRLVGYVGYAEPKVAPVALDARFGGLSVVGQTALPATIPAGGSIRVAMQVRCDSAAGRDLKELANLNEFVHFADATGKPAAQRDKPLTLAGQPAGQCQPGGTNWDASDLVVPPATPPGTYAVVLGFYDPGTGERLKTSAGADSIRLGEVRVTPGK